MWSEIAPALRQIAETVKPEIIFAPQSLGSHVDHEQTIRAVLALNIDADVMWYKDVPYAIRDCAAQPSPLLPSSSFREVVCDIISTLETKIDAIRAYETQLGFQFGGTQRMCKTLQSFHRAEAARVGRSGPVERLLCAKEFNTERYGQMFCKVEKLAPEDYYKII